MKLTQEQLDIINFDLKPKEMLKTLAYAGAGKTSTLVQVAIKYAGKSILYLAYNKSVKEDAVTKFPFNVDVETIHSLAYRHIGYKFREQLDACYGNLKTWDIAKFYRITTYEAARLNASLELFCNSADPYPTVEHIVPDDLQRFDIDKYTVGMVAKLRILWEDVTNGRCGMSHSIYLKMFQLAGVNLGYDIVLLDEAQDTNPVTLAIFNYQVENGAIGFLVGDPYQQIYSWRGAVDAMSQVQAPTLRLSQSFRFGPDIAAFASTMLNRCFGEKVPLSGRIDLASGVRSGADLALPLTVICRTNAGLVHSAYNNANAGRMIAVNGRDAFQETLKLITDIHHLQTGNRSAIDARKISMHKDFASLEKNVKESLDVELQTKVNIAKQYATTWPEVKEAILHMQVAPSNAEVFLTTTHKSKGLEWPNVTIGSDFKALHKYSDGGMPLLCKILKTPTQNDGEVHAEEVNLLYVACTRAQSELNINDDLNNFCNNYVAKETDSL